MNDELIPILTFDSIGASIVVESQTVPPMFQQLISNSLCFLLFEDDQCVPDEWSEVKGTRCITTLFMYLCVGVHDFQ